MRKRTGGGEYQFQGDDESIFTIARASVDVQAPGETMSRGGRFVRWMSRVGGFAHDRRRSESTRRNASRVD